MQCVCGQLSNADDASSVSAPHPEGVQGGEWFYFTFGMAHTLTEPCLKAKKPCSSIITKNYSRFRLRGVNKKEKLQTWDKSLDSCSIKKNDILKKTCLTLNAPPMTLCCHMVKPLSVFPVVVAGAISLYTSSSSDAFYLFRNSSSGIIPLELFLIWYAHCISSSVGIWNFSLRAP